MNHHDTYHDGGYLRSTGRYPWESYSWHDNWIKSWEDEIRKVIIDPKIYSIGRGAFKNCKNITSISIPGVSTIRDSAFYNCYSLTDIVIPEGLSDIGNYVFAGCNSLTDIPEGFNLNITSSGRGTFSGCDGLIEVTIPDSVTSIGEYTFAGCTNLTKVVLPQSITQIGDGAFYNCNSLSEINIPEKVSKISESIFARCTNLTKIVLPQSITQIGKAAFKDCSNLSEINIPENVSRISESTFAGCTNLTKIVLPQSITRIEKNAFIDCSNLSEINIPEKVSKIEVEISGLTTRSPFHNCTSLKMIIWDAIHCKYNGKSALFSFDNVHFGDNVEYIPEYFSEANTKLTELSLPKELKHIGKYAFTDCINLSSLTIPDNVTYIGNSAFSNCYSLTNVTFPQTTNMDTINYGTFSNCPHIESHIDIPEGITYIDEKAFYRCDNISNITLPSTLEYIGEDALVIIDLSNITCYSETPPIINASALSISNGCQLNVPCLSVGLYATDNSWMEHFSSENIYGINPNRIYLKCNNNNYGEATVVTPADCNSDKVTIKATPENGCDFICWKDTMGNIISYNNPYTFSITEDIILIAEFIDNNPRFFEIELMPNDPTMGYVSGGGQYEEGTKVTIKATAFSGYEFIRWSDGNTNNPRTVTINGNIVLQAIFSVREDTYNVSLTSNDETMGSVSGSGEYGEGEVIQITATPNEGYAFLRWSDGNTDNPRTITVDGDIALQAIFESTYVPPVYTVTLTSNDETMGSVSGDGEYEEGEEIEIFAIPKSGYSFVRWSDGNTDNPRTITVTQDTALTAYFSDGRTAVDGTSVSGGVYVTKDGILHIEGHDGEDMSLFTADGALLYEGKVRDYPLPQPGVYLLRIGGETVKVVRP